jgi:hypothetical protein
MFPADFNLECVETPDYLDLYGLYHYEDAKPRYKSKIVLNLQDMGLDVYEQSILADILGARINRNNGKITFVSRELPGLHANTNRCFQLLLEALCRTHEISEEVTKISKAVSDETEKKQIERRAFQAMMTGMLPAYTGGVQEASL